MDVVGNATALGQEPIPLDAGSLFFLAVTIVVFCGPLFVLFPPFPPRKSDALEETHNKLGVPAAKSGLRDQAAGAGAGTTEPPAGSIRSLFIYPVKSCRGVEVSRAKVLPSGLELDRLFTFAQLKSPFPVPVGDGEGEEQEEQEKAARAHRWDFITQRQFPRLATLEVEVWRPDLAKIKGFRDPAAGSSDEAFLVLRFPWRRAAGAGAGPWGLAADAWDSFAAKCTRGWRAGPQLEVVLPMDFPSRDEIARKGYVREPVRVWGCDVPALNMGCELPEELRLYLGVSNKLALFRVDPERPREVAHGCAPSKDEAGYQPVVAFQDSYPVHIMNLASVRDLESKVTKDKDLEELSPRRFRANIFVSGLSPYDEDEWKMVKFKPETSQQQDEASFHVSCRTTRCKLPNVNPDNGIRHPVEPDKTLRAQRAVDEGAPKKGCLGMQMTPLFEDMTCPETYLEVGMSVEVLARGEHIYKA